MNAPLTAEIRRLHSVIREREREIIYLRAVIASTQPKLGAFDADAWMSGRISLAQPTPQEMPPIDS